MREYLPVPLHRLHFMIFSTFSWCPVSTRTISFVVGGEAHRLHSQTARGSWERRGWVRTNFLVGRAPRKEKLVWIPSKWTRFSGRLKEGCV